MEKIAELRFTSELVLERSITPDVEKCGVHECVMTLYKVEENQFCIDWENPVQGVEIGIWTEGKKVVDYDGVFELCKEAVKLLNDAGFDTKEVEA
jgi:hypothetical protein